MTKRIKQPEWYRDIEWSPFNGKKYNLYRTHYKGFDVEVYPVAMKSALSGMGHVGKNGFEYQLYRDNPLAEYDSLFQSYDGGRHPDSKTARRWAINTINEWSD